MSLSVTAKIKGARRLAQALELANIKEKKALEIAIKVEGYRRMRLLKNEIKKGHPGGRHFAPLSMIQQKRTHNKQPLKRLATAVRYYIPKDAKGFEYHLGWTGPKVSKSWKRIAEKHQKGFTLDVTEGMRQHLRQRGIELGKGSKFRRYFFLKKTTTKMVVPARPILEPFWRAYEERTWRNIRKYYQRKLAGERI